MAGFGKNSRMGKRPSSSSSPSSLSCCVTIVIFVALCGLGAWMLTSSAIAPSRTTATTTATLSTSSVLGSSRFLAGDDDTPVELPSVKIKADREEDEDKLASVVDTGEKNSRLEERPSGGGDEDNRSEESLQQEVVVEETSKSVEGSQNGGDEENSEQQSLEIKDEDQVNNAGEQQLVNRNVETGEEENQQQQNEEQIHEEQQREHDEQLPSNDNDEENQQDFQQQQQDESEVSVSQQPKQLEVDENRDQIQQKIDEVTNENQPQLEEKIEEVTNENQQDGNENEQNVETGGGGGEDQQQQQSEDKLNDPNAGDSLRDGSHLDVANTGDANKSPWATQADQSDNEKERRKEEEVQLDAGSGSEGSVGNLLYNEWKLCNVTAGPDYIPCLDNVKAIKKLHNLKHYEHRERHCPEESPTCLVPLQNGYRPSIQWPKSRDRIWYNNVPHTKLVEVKGHQNWVKVAGQYLTFPGGGTQFIHGALHYIDFIQQSIRDIAWGKHTRVILDVGCGVASFGGFLFERDVITMSFAPKDEHEAQVQLALERGIPALSAVMGSQRLPFPSMVFDIVHCARCRVPWHADGGTLLLELNRVLRPGGYFVWSATPVYQNLKEDVEIWNAMKSLTMSMCWDLVTIKKDKLNGVAAAFYRKPTSNECYDKRKHHSPPMCKEDDDPNAAWYIPLKACMHRVPLDASERGAQWPEEWPRRLQAAPYWLNSSMTGVYGKPAPDDFVSDYQHWKRVISKSYLSGLGISWSKVRNVMDMRAVYGGFAAALRDLKVWVMNVVNIDDPDTLPIIYERGLFGIYHDWCESFSTYPRSYDLLHADHLFSRIRNRCDIVPVMVEVDRIVRPGGKLIVRDDSVTISEVENLLKSLHWEVRLTFSKDKEGILCAEKSNWRPEEFVDSS